MALRCASDCCGGGDASGMPHSEMCVSGGDISGLSGVLAGEKVKGEMEERKRIRKTSSYSSACYASDL